MAQKEPLKILFFCNFSGGTTEIVYPSYAFLRNALALRGKKKCARIEHVFFINIICIVTKISARV